MRPRAQDSARLTRPDAAERAWLSEQLRAERLQQRLRATPARSAVASVQPEGARFAAPLRAEQTFPPAP